MIEPVHASATWASLETLPVQVPEQQVIFPAMKSLAQL